MSWSPEASCEYHKLRPEPAMGSDKTYGSSFAPALVKQCGGAMKCIRIDSDAQLDSSLLRGFA